MKSLFLTFPDFIGHPVCFNSIHPHLRNKGDVLNINYSQYWPYEGIEDLASLINVSQHQNQRIFLIGYSFGGFVAYESYKQIIKQNTDKIIKLILIDSKFPNHTNNIKQPKKVYQKLMSDIFSNPRYNYVNMLIELNEVLYQVIQQNLQNYHEYNCLHPIEEAWLINAKLSDSDKKSGNKWKKIVQRLYERNVNDNHFKIVNNKHCIKIILEIINETKRIKYECI